MKQMVTLALILLAGLAHAEEEKESWVLILSPDDQPTTYIPGFTSEKACEAAITKWQKSQQNLFLKAVCVKQ